MIRDHEIVDDWRPRWHSYLPAMALVLAMSITWMAQSPTGGMIAWGVSAVALAQGRYETVVLHIFAHGGAFHLILNSAALLEVGGLVVSRLGGFPHSWLRFLIAFSFAGLSSMIFFLCVHPQAQVPLIGASGAVYGLLGLLLFMRLSEELDPAPARKLPQAVIDFVMHNVLFILLLAVGAGLSSLSGRMAWEAHFGGFLLGFCIGPWVSPSISVNLDQSNRKSHYDAATATTQ